MLPRDAKWVDVIRCMCADETHHRDVNHTYANLKPGELNPFVEEHRKDAAIAWRMRESGERLCFVWLIRSSLLLRRAWPEKSGVVP